jgi:hypothetical protein
MKQITQERVQELFEYRDDGHLIRKKSAGSAKAGSVSASIDAKGYSRTVVDGQNLLTHRVIWVYHNCNLPKQLDHIDGNPMNNKIENLRPASMSENQRNAKVRANNKSGYKGVYFHKTRKSYVAQIRLHGKPVRLGVFANPIDAALAYNVAATELFGEFARLNKMPQTA